MPHRHKSIQMAAKYSSTNCLLNYLPSWISSNLKQPLLILRAILKWKISTAESKSTSARTSMITPWIGRSSCLPWQLHTTPATNQPLARHRSNSGMASWSILLVSNPRLKWTPDICLQTKRLALQIWPSNDWPQCNTVRCKKANKNVRLTNMPRSTIFCCINM